ncbi:MAG TPA: matrixin family metalloprotease [Candidatus Acidoferrum sp.]|nr:matrixin family metalloprotease [Candidatus Acidoferrum sp.]
MTNRKKHSIIARTFAVLLGAFYGVSGIPGANGYAFNEIVPDVRQPASVSGGSACPVASHELIAPGAIAEQWSTVLGTNPVTILTQDQTAAGRLNEIEQAITQSISVWTGVSGTTLLPATFAPLTRTSAQNACGSDGVNSICFDQADGAFTPGILAFTRVITSDILGVQVGTGSPATQVGQILDADIYFGPNNSTITFATPAALAASPKAYDLESLLIHELGHTLGFSHSAVWGAMMYPFAPAPGTFSGIRPTVQQPDAPLGDDDRTGLRVLYPDPSDRINIGSLGGRVVPANPLSLPASPPGVTGIFGAHVVAVDAASGAVIGATLGGWSCTGPGPAQFDGSYQINHLPIGHSYQVYAEPLDNTVYPSLVSPATATLCRNPLTDAGWPPLQACVVPAVNTSFTTHTRPGP